MHYETWLQDGDLVICHDIDLQEATDHALVRDTTGRIQHRVRRLDRPLLLSDLKPPAWFRTEQDEILAHLARDDEREYVSVRRLRDGRIRHAWRVIDAIAPTPPV